MVTVAEVGAAAATVKSNAFIVGTMGILFFSAFFFARRFGYMMQRIE